MSPLQTADATRRLRLGFLTNVPFPSTPGGAARGLEEALELFEFAESVGFDSGWVRQRHFDNYLASPLPLLAAAAQRTQKIRFGTAVISVRYEDPIRLAEDASTVDLLSGGRLELGLAGGIPGLENIWGTTARGHRGETQDRLRRFRDAIAGRPVEFDPPASVGAGGSDTADADAEALPELFVRPRSETLVDRLWYGAGSRSSSAQAGRQRLNLLLSTLNHDPTSDSFEEAQRDNILAYREGCLESGHTPRVAVSRLFMPAVNRRQRELYAEFDRIRRTEGAAGPRPRGALAPGTFVKGALAANKNMPANIQLCEIYHGDPETVLAAAQADVGLALADELIVWLPPNFEAGENRELVANVIEHIAPALGWDPSTERSALAINPDGETSLDTSSIAH